MKNTQFAKGHLFTDEVNIKLHMLGAFVVHRICG